MLLFPRMEVDVFLLLTTSIDRKIGNWVFHTKLNTQHTASKEMKKFIRIESCFERHILTI